MKDCDSGCCLALAGHGFLFHLNPHLSYFHFFNFFLLHPHLFRVHLCCLFLNHIHPHHTNLYPHHLHYIRVHPCCFFLHHLHPHHTNLNPHHLHKNHLLCQDLHMSPCALGKGLQNPPCQIQNILQKQKLEGKIF